MSEAFEVYIGSPSRSSRRAPAFPYDENSRTSGVYAFNETIACHVVSTIDTSRTAMDDHKTTKSQMNSRKAAPIVYASKHLLKPNGSILGRDVAATILPQFPDLLSCIPANTYDKHNNHRKALASVDGRMAISHGRISEFMVDVGHVLHDHVRVGRGHRIAVILPNGSELALAILAVSCWASCVPLNAFAAEAELQSDVEKCGADCIIGMDPTYTGTGKEIKKLAQKLNLPFCGLLPDKNFAGLFELIPPRYKDQVTSPNSPLALLPCKSKLHPSELDVKKRIQPNQHDDEVLVLFTSGTTGTKKLVPHLLSDVLVATACISVSWDLTPSDTNCNLMPLFHVGGIIRQVFSPVLSGGCVICCPSFDPLVFWQLLMNQRNRHNAPTFTWYYAAPTMHQLILQTGRSEGYLLQLDRSKGDDSTGQVTLGQPRLRMIANAAGGLLPSLARELRQAFGANVLPSYGMTECMPISSPPSNYQLERPGTSGVAVGPELAILNKSTLKPVKAGVEGPICVRSEPCFRGYGALVEHSNNGDSQEKPTTFIPTKTGESSGWFDTGDLGYMDADGYLYITGRSKEVINRGGEIISPMEVEDAVVGHPDVEVCAAFSALHSVLQEVVGLVIVMKPGRPRIDMPTLHDFLGNGLLAAPKWPQCLVYMDGGLPKSFTNKLLRVNLSKRLNLPELNDNMSPTERTFQAQCPRQGTEISVAIPCENVYVSVEHVQNILETILVTDPSRQQLIVVNHPRRAGALVAYVYNIDRSHVISVARAKVDGYAVPTHICALRTRMESTNRFLDPPMPCDSIGAILQQHASSNDTTVEPLVVEVQELMQIMLRLDCPPPPTTSFFNLGGSSMLASQLASKVRKLFNVPFGGAEVFQHSSSQAIATIIQERREKNSSDGTNHNVSKQKDQVYDSTSRNLKSIATGSITEASTTSSDLSSPPFVQSRLDIQPGWFGAIVQLLPLCFIHPLWHLTRVFSFFHVLMIVLNNTGVTHVILKFVMTLVAFHLFWVTVTPMIFIVCKWVIIGRYKSGRYPIWGSYYLRWWFVDVLRKMIGRGSWGSSSTTLNLYYRLLGARIGKGARISAQADVCEYDLVSIGSGAAVEISTLRPFGIDNGAMILGPVKVGKNASVGARSVVAPYTSVQENTHLAPISSSYETFSSVVDDEASKHIQYNRQALATPSFVSQLLVIDPIMFIVNSFSLLPGWLMVTWMLIQPWNYDRPFEHAGTMLQWLSDPRRIPFYIGIRISHIILSPFMYMAMAILMKWCIIGKFKAGPRDTTSQWQLIRHALAAQLFTREKIQNVTDIVGRHYELVSVLYRLLGAKVGKRVFWPGRQPIFTGEFDLLEIGDDVVFGSRACLFCTTLFSAEKIVLCAGSNVSDNTVVLPGSIIGKGAVLGSNTICPAGRYLPESSVWLGSRDGEPVMLEAGSESYGGPMFAADVKPSQIQMEGDRTTIKPFGKAFYKRRAKYFVYPLWLIIGVTGFIRAVAAVLSSLPILAALQAVVGFLYGWSVSERDYLNTVVPLSTLFPAFLAFFIMTHLIHVLIWLGVEFVSKWGLMGQRREGRFNYDKSPYAQTWEIYQTFGKFRDLGRVGFLDMITGTPYMAMFFRMLGCEIGKHCCLYPTGGDPYMPEPDLVKMGDRCVIDCASVVCHLNTRGNFELKRIVMENNVTLRTRSRIQQAVTMESGSMLLEKSLALTGEIIESDSIWVGGPASCMVSYDTGSVDTTTRPSTINDLSYFGNSSNPANRV